MKHGDFTHLASNYSAYRPGYSPFILDIVAATVGGRTKALDVADIGAGTGIWSRQLARAGCRVTAVEPNDEMRGHGEVAEDNGSVRWLKGSAEASNLPAASFDLVTMASSFHWPDFDAAVAEFRRILRPGGYVLALWNTRAIERNPFLVEIENTLKAMVPDLKRVSSGRSAFCDGLLDRLIGPARFADVTYLEAYHVERQSRDRYVGLWRSVNDIQVQAGPERFARFMSHIENATKDMPHIDAHYQTRAWLARM